MIRKLLVCSLVFVSIHFAMAQPQKLSDLSGNVFQFFLVNNKILFSDHNLWKTEGTPSSTTRLTWFDANSGVVDMLLADTILYFSVEGSNGYRNQLWKSDGTVAGTVPVKIFTHENEHSINNFFYWKGTTYFMFSDRLYKTDGSEEGTVQIIDLDPDYNDNNADAIFCIKNTLYIAFKNQLWKSDGTASGTTLLQSFDYMNYLNSFGDYAMLEVDDAVHGREPWRLDESGNVQLLKDINPGPAGSVGLGISNSGYELNGQYYFTVTEPYRLFKTDGTEAGTTEYFEGIVDVRPLNGKLYIFKDNELWRSDGISTPQLVRAFDGVLGTYCIIGDLIVVSEDWQKLWVFNSYNDSFKFITEFPASTADTFRSSDIGIIFPTDNEVYFALQTEEYKRNEFDDDYSNTFYELYKYSPFQSGVSSFTLVDWSTGSSIRSLKSVDTVYTDEAVRIRANTFGSAFTSVEFYLNDALHTTVSSDPYILGEYVSGSDLHWLKQEGIYNLKAITVSDSNTLSNTVTLHVVKRSITSLITHGYNDSGIEIYPNPVMDNMYIRLNDRAGEAFVTVSNLKSIEIYSGISAVNYNGTIEMDVSGLLAKPGIYIVKVIAPSGMYIGKILKK